MSIKFYIRIYGFEFFIVLSIDVDFIVNTVKLKAVFGDIKYFWILRFY